MLVVVLVLVGKKRVTVGMLKCTGIFNMFRASNMVHLAFVLILSSGARQNFGKGHSLNRKRLLQTRRFYSCDGFVRQDGMAKE